MPRTSTEIANIMEVKQTELLDLYNKHKTDKVDEGGRPIFDMDAKTLQECRERDEELTCLGKEWEEARALDIFAKTQQDKEKLSQVERHIDRGADPKTRQQQVVNHFQKGGSLTDLVIETREYKGRSGPKFGVSIEEFDMKTLMALTAGFAAPNDRGPRVVFYATRRPMVSDVIPSDTTTNNVIKWMEETTFTNAAAATAEGGLKQESALAYTERTSIVEKIATWIPVTEEQIDDVPQIRGIIDNRLILMLMQEEEDQLLNGDGSSPNLDGFLHKSGVQSQAKGADPAPDAVFKAFTKVRWTGFAEPSAVILHPNDWQDIRLLRTNDDQYLFGPPTAPGEEMLWGKRVIITPAITENTGLTGDFVLYSHISRKMGIRIDVSDSHDTYFIYNKLAIRAEMREALEIYRPAAFCKITSL